MAYSCQTLYFDVMTPTYLPACLPKYFPVQLRAKVEYFSKGKYH